jgi:flagellar hook-length control protein FliK
VIPQAQVTRQSEAGQQQAILQNRVAAVEVALLKELLKEAEATHARVQLNQVSMLKDPESVSTPNLWLFDVPVKDKERIELLQVRVEQHKHNAEELEGDIWEVQLRLDTEQLGPLQAMISLHEQDVKVQLTAQWPDTASLLEVSIDELTNNLSGLGVTVSHMDCQCGEVAPVSHQLVSNDIPKGLLDISV